MATATELPIRRIHYERLEELLGNVKGAKMCTVITETDVRMRKTNNPYFGLITKRQRMNVTINFIYENSVNRVRTKEGGEPDFEAHPRKWGIRRQGTPFVDHNGMVYVECKPNNVPMFQEYFHKVSGEMMLKEEFEQFIIQPSSNAAHQGVSEASEVFVRDFKLENVTDLIMDNIHYKIRK